MVVKTEDGWWLGKGMSKHGSAEEAHQSYAREYSWPRKTGEAVLSPPTKTDEKLGERKLQVFLCHASEDKSAVLDIYGWLEQAGVDPWLDTKSLLPGQNWENEIAKALKATDIVIVFLSKASITKRGYVQKELRQALDEADRLPDGSIFLIPLKLDDSEIPQRLSRLHAVNYFAEDTKSRLASAFAVRAMEIGAIVPKFNA